MSSVRERNSKRELDTRNHEKMQREHISMCHCGFHWALESTKDIALSVFDLVSKNSNLHVISHCHLTTVFLLPYRHRLSHLLVHYRQGEERVSITAASDQPPQLAYLSWICESVWASWYGSRFRCNHEHLEILLPGNIKRQMLAHFVAKQLNFGVQSEKQSCFYRILASLIFTFLCVSVYVSRSLYSS